MSATLQAPHHTVLFNIAGLTMLQLTPEDHKQVYSYIEDTINGDGLYEGASKETILQAYYDMNLCDQYDKTWADVIQALIYELGLQAKYLNRGF